MSACPHGTIFSHVVLCYFYAFQIMFKIKEAKHFCIVYYPIFCVLYFQSCVKFVEDSLPINLGESSKRNSLEFSFTYGSKGTIIEYSKEEVCNLTHM